MEASWKVQKIENQKLLPRRGDWFAHVLKTQGVALGWEQVAPLGRRCYDGIFFESWTPFATNKIKNRWRQLTIHNA